MIEPGLPAKPEIGLAIFSESRGQSDRLIAEVCFRESRKIYPAAALSGGAIINDVYVHDLRLEALKVDDRLIFLPIFDVTSVNHMTSGFIYRAFERIYSGPFNELRTASPEERMGQFANLLSVRFCALVEGDGGYRNGEETWRIVGLQEGIKTFFGLADELDEP